MRKSRGRKGPRSRRRALEAAKYAKLDRLHNGAFRWLPGVDGRSHMALKARSIARRIMSDLGGHKNLTEPQLQLIQRATLMSIQCEVLESQLLQGKVIDFELYGKLSTRIATIFYRLGVKATDEPRPVIGDDAIEVEFVRRVIVDPKVIVERKAT